MSLSSIHGIIRARRALTIPFLLLLSLFAFAQPAAAHHASIDASATCSDGHYVVDWQALSWVATDGTTDSGGRAAAWRGLNQHPGITISYRIGRHGPFTPLDGVHTLTAAETTPVVINGHPHDFPSATSSFELPGDTAGRLVVRATVGPWGPDPRTGRYVTLGPRTQDSDPIRLAGDCEGSEPAPAIPSASAVAVCVSGSPVIRVTLANGNVVGGEPFTFSVSADAAGSQPSFSQTGIVVAADSSTTVDVPVDEDGSRTVAATGTGFSQSFTLSGNCVADPNPGASLAVVCVDGAGVIRATLSNDNGAGGQSVTFSVTSPAGGGLPGFSQDVTVAGGATSTVDIPGQEDLARTVTITAPGMTTVSETLTVNCVASPAPKIVSVEQECFFQGIRVTVQNDNGAGGEPVDFTVTSVAGGGFGDFSATFTVEGGQTRSMDVPVVEDGTRVVVVSAPGMTTQTFTVTLDCVAEPAP